MFDYDCYDVYDDEDYYNYDEDYENKYDYFYYYDKHNTWECPKCLKMTEKYWMQAFNEYKDYEIKQFIPETISYKPDLKEVKRIDYEKRQVNKKKRHGHKYAV
jgi:hypothetical protein